MSRGTSRYGELLRRLENFFCRNGISSYQFVPTGIVSGYQLDLGSVRVPPLIPQSKVKLGAKPIGRLFDDSRLYFLRRHGSHSEQLLKPLEIDIDDGRDVEREDL